MDYEDITESSSSSLPDNDNINFNTFTLHPVNEDFIRQEYIRNLYILMEIIKETAPLKILIEKGKPSDQSPSLIPSQSPPIDSSQIIFQNIKPYIDICNKMLEQTIILYNSYINGINKIIDTVNINLNKIEGTTDKIHITFIETATYHPIILKDYNFPVVQELVNFMIYLKDRIINIYKQVIQIAPLIEEFKSEKEIEEFILKEIRSKGIVI